MLIESNNDSFYYCYCFMNHDDSFHRPCIPYKYIWFEKYDTVGPKSHLHAVEADYKQFSLLAKKFFLFHHRKSVTSFFLSTFLFLLFFSIYIYIKLCIQNISSYLYVLLFLHDFLNPFSFLNACLALQIGALPHSAFLFYLPYNVCSCR